MKIVNVPKGQLITDRSFVVDYVAAQTGRIVDKVMLDGNIEIAYTGDERNKGLRTIIVKNDVRPDDNLDTVNVTLNISKKTDRKVTLEFTGDYDLDINWGDGYIQKLVGSGLVTIEHLYTTDGVKRFSLDGHCTNLNFTSETAVILSSLGNMGLEKVSFSNCTNLIKLPKKLPVTIKDLSYSFSRCDRLDVSNMALWDFKNVVNLEGLLAFTKSKEFVLRDLESENLENIDRLFYNAIDCVLKFINCKFPKLTKLESVFELSKRPVFSIADTELTNLSIVDKLFFESNSDNETRGGFYVLDSTIGGKNINSFVVGANNINIVLERVVFPSSEEVKDLFLDIIDTNIRLRDLTFGTSTNVSQFFSGIYSSVSDNKSTISIHGNTLAKVTDFYKFLSNMDSCSIEFTFKEFLSSSPITNLNSLFYSLSNCDINLNDVVIDHIDLTNIIVNCFDCQLKTAFVVDEEMSIKNVCKDSNIITLDFSDSHFKNKVKFGPLAPGMEKITFLANNMQFDNDVQYIKPLQDHDELTFEINEHNYRKSVYLDCLTDNCTLTSMSADNWEIVGNLNLICLLRETELLAEFQSVNVNGWYVAGTINEQTLINYVPQLEGYTVGLFKNCRITKVSMRNWTLEKLARLNNICKDVIGVNDMDLEGWRVGTIEMNHMFSNCNATINMKRWTFREDVVLESTFSDCNNYNRTITLDNSSFNKSVNLLNTWKSSNVNVSLVSVKFRGVTTFVSTFEDYGSASAPLDVSIIIKGLSTLDLKHVTVINSFMKNLGHEIQVNGLEGLMLWSLPSDTAIIDPFLGATMSISPPF